MLSKSQSALVVNDIPPWAGCGRCKPREAGELPWLSANRRRMSNHLPAADHVPFSPQARAGEIVTFVYW